MERLKPIEFQTYIDKPVSEVYQSLITPAGWDGCFTTGMEIDHKAKKMVFRWKNLGPDKVSDEAPSKILKVEENKTFEFTFNEKDLPEPTHVTLKFTPKGKGTVLQIRDEGYPKTKEGEAAHVGCATGWTEFATLLKVYLETGYQYRNW